MRYTKIKLILLCIALGFNNCCLASEVYELNRKYEDDSNFFSITHENDFFADQDLGYTSGVRFSWLSTEKNTSDFIKKTIHSVPFVPDNGHKRYSVSFGQTLFTPENLNISQLQTNDRPYAGHVFLNMGLINDMGKMLDNFQIELGLVGPSALGKETQQFIHNNISGVYPRGWHNQLKDEVGVGLTYEKKIRTLYELTPKGYGVEFTPTIGGTVGNFYTHLNYGFIFKFGHDLPFDYGPPLINPNLPGSDFFINRDYFSYYFFIGLEGRSVIRNIFLDGNTFRNSHHVKKRSFTSGIQAGISILLNDYRLSYTHNFKGKEFKEQRKKDEFGALTLSMRF